MWPCNKNNMWDPFSYCNIIFIILVILYSVNIILHMNVKKEAFGATSPGTMVQLQTSHVPTEQDEYYWRYIYPRQVKREIYNLTESDL
jgi:hypothetical protein